ncbi:HEAT repeat domain-containing protein [Neptunitalea lumnitzerae]|uniref:DNA alkylation repair enzyme n=1 Tax=Neptunitalea lumnitzerae TaxID=2965509 RepID=A0ABQ5MEI9_9FLAO|nr:HEAT repeat domain-containing protein [Neptunitalea sp. Y10]GLB47809.1 hypothetical protein Y10_01770 [Neptunitalea sp. Y10]
MEATIAKLQTIAHGFKPIEGAAKRIFECKTTDDCFAYAYGFLKYNSYQIRCLGVFILGKIAAKNPRALQILQLEVSNDPSWQVQETLAKAFDQYCKDVGYENALPTIKDWLQDTNPNVCRAATEGLRIWTGRSYFAQHPEVAIQLLSSQKNNDSAYVRKSVGNALRDINKKYPQAIATEISSWNIDTPNTRFTYNYVTKDARKKKAIA